jgi:hypothetical protein
MIDELEPAVLREYTGQERGILVGYWLATGARLTTAEIAARLELTRPGAWWLMQNASRVLPVNLIDGRWQMMR